MRFLRHPLTWCFFLAVIVRAALFTPTIGGDTPRFFEQAEGFLLGEGFRNVTMLPPGYPVFLAIVGAGAGDSLDSWHFATWILHIIMSLASCYLVYAAIRPVSPRAAIGAFLCMAVSPILALCVGYLISETFSVFLVSVLVYTLSRCEILGTNLFRAFAVGFLCVAILLTAPATIFLAFFVWCYLAWCNRSSFSNLAALAAGSLLLMIPWQIHCYQVLGRIEPRVLTRITGWPEGWSLWCRTWVSNQADFVMVWFYPEQFDRIPASVFSSDEQRQELKTLRLGDGQRGVYGRSEISEPFEKAARERIAQNPTNFYVFLPARRALTLWFDFSFGWNRAIQQFERVFRPQNQERPDTMTSTGMRFLVGSAGALAYDGVHIFLLIVMIMGLRSRRALPWLILASVLIYTGWSAYEAVGEYRRNLPFYPAILFSLYYFGTYVQSRTASRAPEK